MTPYITTGKEEAPSYIQDGVHLYMRKEGFKKAAGTAAKCVLTAALVFNTAVPAYAFDGLQGKMQTEGTNSINAHEGDYIELNCSDLKYSGVYSEDEYNNMVEQKKEELTNGHSEENDNIAAVLKQLTENGEIKHTGSGTEGSKTAGLETETVKESVIKKKDLDRFLSGTGGDSEYIKNSPEKTENEKLKKLVERALDYAKAAQLNDDWVEKQDPGKDGGGTVEYGKNASEVYEEGKDKVESTARSYDGSNPEDLVTASGERVKAPQNSTWDGKSYTLTDSYGEKHKLPDGLIPIDTMDGENGTEVEYVDFGIIKGRKENNGKKYTTRSIVAARKCSICGAYYTVDTPCKCGEKGTEWEDQTPKYLMPAPLSYNEKGETHGISGDYVASKKIDLTITGHDDNSPTVKDASHDAIAVTYRCAICERKISLALDYGKDTFFKKNEAPHVVMTKEGTAKQICGYCYNDMRMTTKDGLKLDESKVKKESTWDGSVYYTNTPENANDKDSSDLKNYDNGPTYYQKTVMSYDSAQKVMNGYYDKEGRWHYYIDDQTTTSYITVCKKEDLEKTYSESGAGSFKTENNDVPGSQSFDPGAKDLTPPMPEEPDKGQKEKYEKQAQEYDEMVKKIKDILGDDFTAPTYTDPGKLSTDADREKSESIENEMSDIEKTIIDPNEQIKNGNKIAQAIWDHFQKEVKGGSGELLEESFDKLKEKGIIKPGDRQEQVISRLERWLAKNGAWHTDINEETNVLVQRTTKQHAEQLNSNITHVITAFSLKVVDNSTGETVAGADGWNGGSLFFTVGYNKAKPSYSAYRTATLKDVKSDVLVTYDTYKCFKEGESEPFYEYTVVDSVEGTNVQDVAGGETFKARTDIYVDRVKSSLTVNGKSFPTERLW